MAALFNAAKRMGGSVGTEELPTKLIADDTAWLHSP